MLTGFPRGSFVMATNYCICSILPYSAVENLVDLHPEAFTTLVQTMVRMYKLKPKMTWEDISTKLKKGLGIDDDWGAFDWFRSHSDVPEAEELYAKAFDLALMRLKVPHLDRRIFWSELDRDAAGGISFEEFKGKLLFGKCEDLMAEELDMGLASTSSLMSMSASPSRRSYSGNVFTQSSSISSTSSRSASPAPVSPRLSKPGSGYTKSLSGRASA